MSSLWGHPIERNYVLFLCTFGYRNIHINVQKEEKICTSRGNSPFSPEILDTELKIFSFKNNARSCKAFAGIKLTIFWHKKIMKFYLIFLYVPLKLHLADLWYSQVLDS